LQDFDANVASKINQLTEEWAEGKISREMYLEKLAIIISTEKAIHGI
jgi:hypothetical protein